MKPVNRINGYKLLPPAVCNCPTCREDRRQQVDREIAERLTEHQERRAVRALVVMLAVTVAVIFALFRLVTR